MTKRPRVREKVVQHQIVHLLRSVGCEVYVLGTVRPRTDAHHGTRQTPGLADLEVFVPDRARSRYELLKVECKADGGRLSVAQRAYQARCRAAGVEHLVGGVDDVLRWLAQRGLVRLENVPHYRSV